MAPDKKRKAFADTVSTNQHPTSIGTIDRTSIVRLEPSGLANLVSALLAKKYTLLGPTLRDGAIVYDRISSSSDLPVGWTDRQDAGYYRVERDDLSRFFHFTVGPLSWKRFLFPPSMKLFTMRRTAIGFETTDETFQNNTIPPLQDHNGDRLFAFIGVRACELNALALQDNIFISKTYTDPYYKAMRENAFIVAVDCGKAGGTCFCASMGTGPACSQGFDIVLTEVASEGEHFFLAFAGTTRGSNILNEIPQRNAKPSEIESGKTATAATASNMGRSLDTTNIQNLLHDNFDYKHWEEIASRCLTCANCTMVCPTCFCSTVEEVTDLTGQHAERWRRWDSCFTLEFSYIHGGSMRSTRESRYRQWITHKLSYWIDQFGASGCVGCGRCITWCPVGIDITAEVHKLRQAEPLPTHQ
jgi:ferredoxin